MCFFPAPAVLKVNKARALWGFAISAVRYTIRKEDWSWAFFKQRTANRKRFIELYIRSTRFGKPLTTAEQVRNFYYFGWLHPITQVALDRTRPDKKVHYNTQTVHPLLTIVRSFTTADSRFYHSIGNQPSLYQSPRLNHHS
jgi:hypothetical protein